MTNTRTVLIATTKAFEFVWQWSVIIVVIIVAFASAIAVVIFIVAPAVAFLSIVVHVVSVITRRIEHLECIMTHIIYAAVKCASDVVVAVSIIVFSYAN